MKALTIYTILSFTFFIGCAQQVSIQQLEHTKIKVDCHIKDQAFDCEYLPLGYLALKVDFVSIRVENDKYIITGYVESVGDDVRIEGAGIYMGSSSGDKISIQADIEVTNEKGFFSVQLPKNAILIVDFPTYLSEIYDLSKL